jgi:hypothetical protein
MPVIALLLAIFAGAANSQSDIGKVTFFRPAGYLRLAKITVYCDGKEIAAFPDRSRLTVRMREGMHRCYEKNDAKRKIEPLIIALGRDEELFVQLSWSPADSPFAIKARPRLKLQKSGWHPDENDPLWRELRIVK